MKEKLGAKSKQSALISKASTKTNSHIKRWHHFEQQTTLQRAIKRSKQINGAVRSTAKRLAKFLILKCAGQLTTIHVRGYGRLGNNIQQILIAKMHVEKYGCRVSLSKSLKQSLITAGGTEDFFSNNKPLTLISGQQRRGRRAKLSFRINADLFFYRSAKWRMLNTFVSPTEFTENIGIIAEPLRDGLSKRNKLLIDEYKRQDICLLHLRGGDISDLTNTLYVTNPLSFYHWLLQQSDRFSLVTEPNCRHPLFDEICKLLMPESIVSHREFEKDFNALASCTSIATSGVGTFAIAAALLNKNLKKLYFSNALCEEHLNPHLIDPKVQKFCYQLTNTFFNKWSEATPQQRVRLLKSS